MSRTECPRCAEVGLTLMAVKDPREKRSCAHALCSNCTTGKCLLCQALVIRQSRNDGRFLCQVCPHALCSNCTTGKCLLCQALVIRQSRNDGRFLCQVCPHALCSNCTTGKCLLCQALVIRQSRNDGRFLCQVCPHALCSNCTTGKCLLCQALVIRQSRNDGRFLCQVCPHALCSNCTTGKCLLCQALVIRQSRNDGRFLCQVCPHALCSNCTTGKCLLCQALVIRQSRNDGRFLYQVCPHALCSNCTTGKCLLCQALVIRQSRNDGRFLCQVCPHALCSNCTTGKCLLCQALVIRQSRNDGRFLCQVCPHALCSNCTTGKCLLCQALVIRQSRNDGRFLCQVCPHALCSNCTTGKCLLCQALVIRQSRNDGRFLCQVCPHALCSNCTTGKCLLCQALVIRQSRNNGRFLCQVCPHALCSNCTTGKCLLCQALVIRQSRNDGRFLCQVCPHALCSNCTTGKCLLCQALVIRQSRNDGRFLCQVCPHALCSNCTTGKCLLCQALVIRQSRNDGRFLCQVCPHALCSNCTTGKCLLCQALVIRQSRNDGRFLSQVCPHALCSNCTTGKCLLCQALVIRQSRNDGRFLCQACGKATEAKDCWLCEEPSKRLLCTSCLLLSPDQHPGPIKPFQNVRSVSEVKRRLQCEDFKYRMKLREFMVKVADGFCDMEWSLGKSLGEAYPNESECELSPSLDAKQAARLAKKLLSSARKEVKEEATLLSRLEDIGVSDFIDRVVSALSPPPTSEPSGHEKGAKAAGSSRIPGLMSIQLAPPLATMRPAQKVEKAPKTAGLPFPAPSLAPSSIGLPRGKILIFRGAGESVETLFPSHPLIGIGKPSPIDMIGGAALLLPSGNVMCVGAGGAQTLDLSAVGGSLPNWRSLPHQPMAKNRRNAVLLSSGDKHYLCCGYINDGASRSVEVLEKGEWSAGPRISGGGRARAAGVVLDDCLILVGGIGRKSKKCAASAMILDTRNLDPRWRSVQCLGRRTSDAAALTVGSKIFVVGGIADTGNGYTYRPQPLTYTLQLLRGNRYPSLVSESGPPLNYARAGHGLVSVGNVIYAIGGFGDGSVSEDVVGRSIERLDTAKLPLKWELLGDQLREKAVHATVISLAH